MLDMGYRLFSKNAFLSVSKLHLHSVSINKHRQGTDKPERLETHTNRMFQPPWHCIQLVFVYTDTHHDITSGRTSQLKNRHGSCDWVAQKRKIIDKSKMHSFSTACQKMTASRKMAAVCMKPHSSRTSQKWAKHSSNAEKRTNDKQNITQYVHHMKNPNEVSLFSRTPQKDAKRKEQNDKQK